MSSQPGPNDRFPWTASSTWNVNRRARCPRVMTGHGAATIAAAATQANRRVADEESPCDAKAPAHRSPPTSALEHLTGKVTRGPLFTVVRGPVDSSAYRPA